LEGFGNFDDFMRIPPSPDSGVELLLQVVEDELHLLADELVDLPLATPRLTAIARHDE